MSEFENGTEVTWTSKDNCTHEGLFVGLHPSDPLVSAVGDCCGGVWVVPTVALSPVFGPVTVEEVEEEIAEMLKGDTPCFNLPCNKAGTCEECRVALMSAYLRELER